MTNQQLLDVFRQRGLMPFQAEFAANVLSDSPLHVHLLEAPPGTGSHHTICHIVGEAMQRGQLRRVLFLTGSVELSYQMREQLKQTVATVPVHFADRRLLREFEVAGPVGSEPWPQECVIVSTIDFAKRGEVASYFTDSSWDMIVFDEAHGLAGPSARREFFRVMTRQLSNTRVLIISPVDSHILDDTLRSFLPSPPNSSANFSKTIWRKSELRDWSGTPLTRNLVRWEVIHYNYREEEKLFYGSLATVAHRLDSLYRANSFLYQMLISRAVSSPYSVESSLYEQKKRLYRAEDHVSGIGSQQTLFDLEPESVQPSLSDLWNLDAEHWDTNDSTNHEEASELVTKLLERLDELEYDSKLDTLIALIAERTSSSSYVCVVSCYAHTINYLATALTDAGHRVFPITGEQPLETRQYNLSVFQDKGGILLITDAALRGISLPGVEHVVHYDLALSPEALQMRVARFDRLGRQNEVMMYALLAEGDDNLMSRIHHKAVECIAKISER